MALWKPFRGNRAVLDSVEKHDGYIYFCIDDGSLFFDFVDDTGNLQRRQINANEASKLVGYDIVTELNSSNSEIPTSKSILTELQKYSTIEYVDEAIASISVPDITSLATEEYVNSTIEEAKADAATKDVVVLAEAQAYVDNKTADDFGIFVQTQEPADAVPGDIWIDTANDPTYIPPTIPTITEADNGKVLMVVNGQLQLVSLNLSVDANGVVSI